MNPERKNWATSEPECEAPLPVHQEDGKKKKEEEGE